MPARPRHTDVPKPPEPKEATSDTGPQHRSLCTQGRDVPISAYLQRRQETCCGNGLWVNCMAYVHSSGCRSSNVGQMSERSRNETIAGLRRNHLCHQQRLGATSVPCPSFSYPVRQYCSRRGPQMRMLATPPSRLTCGKSPGWKRPVLPFAERQSLRRSHRQPATHHVVRAWDRKQVAVSWGQCPGAHNTRGMILHILYGCIK